MAAELIQDDKVLGLAPTVPVWRAEDGTYGFDRKFYDGACLMQQEWRGPLRCIMNVATVPPLAFGMVYARPSDLPFEVFALPSGVRIGEDEVRGVHLVIASGDSFEQFHVVDLCRRLGVKCVYAIEYDLDTRIKMLSMVERNPIIWARRALFLYRGEWRRRHAFRAADALQSNGTPAAALYAPICRDIHTFFDTRTSKEELVDLDVLEARVLQLTESRPLRLAFSGRFVKAKGADHLVQLAKLLRDAGLDFSMALYGAGDLEGYLHQFVDTHGLADRVHIGGVLDFSTELMPRISREVDLFVLLHRQSDPSCTYLETLAAGVPIVGYLNKAFAGILALADVGWGAPLDDVEAIKNTILTLDRSRAELSRKSFAAREFAMARTFESMIARRCEHLRQVAGC